MMYTLVSSLLGRCRWLGMGLLIAVLPVTAEMVWVTPGVTPAPIVVPVEDPTGEVYGSAEDLAGYVEAITGQRPDVIEGTPEPLPERAVWVGYQPALDGLFPELDFAFTEPEEILLAANDSHLVIVGRDREPFMLQPPVVYRAAPNGEFGTANAVSTFIHDRLGVRWLWPGELGTDIPRRERLAFEPFTYRFHPPIRSRRFRLEPRYARRKPGDDIAAVNYFWENAHRTNRRSSHRLPRDHAYNHWSDLYRETHPEYFAMLPDGTRAEGRNAKLCISNPAVADQWLDEQEVVLSEYPQLDSLGATPNDGGGWCVCEDCRALDHPEEPPGVHTERYVNYWNRLIRGLRERVPERNVFLDMLAYGVYKVAPIKTRLEDGIAVSFVGHYPLSNEAEWEQVKAGIRAWKAAGAKYVGYRPNYHWYDGGYWGMPSVAMAKTHALFDLLAEVECHVFEVDSLLMFSSTQGPQHYLMARLSYDPSADGRAILRDFYERGFGPAADAVRSYYEFLEALHVELVENPSWRISSSARFEHLELLRRIHTPERIAEARAILDRAQAATEGAAPVYAERVRFVRAGLEYVALNMEAAGYMERVRRSQGGDREAVKRALEVCAKRDKLLEEAPPFAIDTRLVQVRIVAHDSTMSRKMGDYLGPPNPEFLAAKPVEAPKRLAVVQTWREDYSDTFDRANLGEAWEVASGNWAIEDGLLVATGDREDNVLLLTKPMPGLQRVEFVAAAVPPGWEADPAAKAGDVCDLSALIQTAAEQPLGGYTIQFGARFNSANGVRRERAFVVNDASEDRLRIEPGRFYTIVAEFDGRHVRLSVDGQIVAEYEEEAPLHGPDHDRIGLYTYTPMQVKSVRVFTAEARAEEFFDDPDTN